MILVLDDDPLFIKSIRHFWKSIVTANTIDEALAVAREKRPRVGILDIYLTNKGLTESGFDAAAKLREIVPDMVILMVSSYPSPAARKAAEKVDAVGIIDKLDTNFLKTLMPILEQKASSSASSATSSSEQQPPSPVRKARG